MFKGTIKKKAKGKGGGTMVCAIKRVRKFQLKDRKKKALFREVSLRGGETLKAQLNFDAH